MGLEAPNIQFPGDIPHLTSDRGTGMLVVRRDTDGSICNAHGDYTWLQVDANGYLRVSGSVAVSGTATVTATDLDIRNLSASQDGVRVDYQENPSWVNTYSYADVFSGVAAANVFVSLFNPAASGRNLILLSVAVESYSVAVAAATNTFTLDRISTATGGSVAGGVAVFRSDDPDRVAVIRTANPTVTANQTIARFAPNQNVTAVGTTAVSLREYRFDPSWGEFLLKEDQGVCFRQTVAGDTDQRLVVTIVWAER